MAIPQRYKDKGFNKVGQKKKAPSGAKHKWEVLAKKGDSYKIVKGGYRGMKDYSQHKDSERRKKFWSRMGGKDSSKAKDPFSPLYWHKKFGTWQDGGMFTDDINEDLYQDDFINTTGYTEGTPTEDNPYNIIPSSNITMDNVDEELLAVILGDNGETKGFKFMEPDKDYNFKDAKAVMEIPTYKKGGQPSQEWLSEKISRLLKDGTAKNRDQAVAIAYSMYNKHQLGNLNLIPPVDSSLQGFQTPFNTQTGLKNTLPVSNQGVSSLPEQNIVQTPITPEEILQDTVKTSMKGVNPVTGTSLDPNQANQERFQPRERVEQVQFFNPYAGVDIPTASAVLGESLANKDTLGTVGASGKLLFGLARNTLGAYANQQRTNQIMKDYYNRQKRDMNTPTFMQQGGQVNLDNFEEELLKEIMQNQPTQQPMQQDPLNLGKYQGLNYFNIDSVDGRYLLRNTQKNPQNPAGFSMQLRELRKLNPNIDIQPQYQRYQDGGSTLTEQDILNIQQEAGRDIDPNLINMFFEKKQPVVPDSIPDVNLGKYSDVGYFEVLENRPDLIQLRNTQRSPHTRETINTIIPQLRKLNPDREIDIMFQQGGSMEELLDFNEEEFINEILSSQKPQTQTPQSPFNLGKYQGQNYFDVNTLNGQYIIRNTDRNPQNAAGFNMQLQQLRKLNPTAKIVPQYMNFQKGGSPTNAQILTGEYMTGLEDQPFNGEVEAGEYYQTAQGDIAEIKGKKHSNGGEKLNMQVGDRVLTDHTKLGAKNAKYIRDNFDLNIKAKDTYSDVLDRFRTKMGLNKLVDEEEKLIEKLEKEQEKNDSQTKSLNIEHLTNKINEINKKKEPIEEARKSLFDSLFNLQESEKDFEMKSEFEKGGVKKMAMDMGIPEDKAFQLFKQYKSGAMYSEDTYQDGGTRLEKAKKNHENFNKLYQPIVDRVDNKKFLGDFNNPGLIDKLVSNQELSDKKGYSYDNLELLLNVFNVPDNVKKYNKSNEKEYIDYWLTNPSISTNSRPERKIPEMDSTLEELQNLILSYDDNTLADTLSKDYSKMGMFNFTKFLPEGVNMFEALKYFNHLKKLTKENTFKTGGEYQDGGDKKKVETEIVGGINPYNIKEDFVRQSKGEGIFFGKATADRLQALEQNFPLLVNKTFNIERDDNGNITNASIKKGETIENFQKAVDQNYEALIQDAERLGDPSRVKSFVNKVQNERFNNDLVARAFDSKFGNFTSSRPNFGFRSVTSEDLEKLKQQGITTYKQLVDENGEIKQGIDISPESKKLLERFKGAKSNFLLGDKEIVGSPESIKTLERTETFVPDDKKEDRKRLNVALFPDQTPMMPGALQPHLKVKRRFERVVPETIDPEPFLEEIFQQQAVADRQLEGLPPNVAAAAKANNLANTQKAVSNTMLNIETQNQRARGQANQINAQTQRMEENAAASDALSYEQRQLRAKAITDRDIENYYDQLQALNTQRFLDVNELNLRNALMDDVKYLGDGTFTSSPAPIQSFKNQLEAMMAQQSKNK